MSWWSIFSGTPVKNEEQQAPKPSSAISIVKKTQSDIQNAKNDLIKRINEEFVRPSEYFSETIAEVGGYIKNLDDNSIVKDGIPTIVVKNRITTVDNSTEHAMLATQQLSGLVSERFGFDAISGLRKVHRVLADIKIILVSVITAQQFDNFSLVVKELVSLKDALFERTIAALELLKNCFIQSYQLPQSRSNESIVVPSNEEESKQLSKVELTASGSIQSHNLKNN
jgi:hypothetical protein